MPITSCFSTCYLPPWDVVGTLLHFELRLIKPCLGFTPRRPTTPTAFLFILLFISLCIDVTRNPSSNYHPSNIRRNYTLAHLDAEWGDYDAEGS